MTLYQHEKSTVDHCVGKTALSSPKRITNHGFSGYLEVCVQAAGDCVYGHLNETDLLSQLWLLQIVLHSNQVRLEDGRDHGRRKLVLLFSETKW